MPMAVTAVNSLRHDRGRPSWRRRASFINPRPQGEADAALRDFWAIGGPRLKYGNKLDRADWRLVINCYLRHA